MSPDPSCAAVIGKVRSFAVAAVGRELADGLVANLGS